MVKGTKEMIIDLGLPEEYSTKQKPKRATSPGLAAIRGNAPPDIIVTHAATPDGTLEERYSERSSVVQDLGRELRFEHWGRSRIDTDVRQSHSHPNNILQGISGGNEPQEAQWTIQKLLRSESVYTSEGSDKAFIPLDAQEAIINHARVEEELKHIYLGLELNTVVSYVCGNPELGPNKRGMQIFAILTFIGKQGSIGAFEKAGISDGNLPFQMSKRGDGNFQLVPNEFSNDLRSLNCSIGWDDRDNDDFFTYQWRFLSPFFDKESTSPPLYYPFEDNIILPWRESRVDETGGNSDVHMIQIHEAHHGFGRGKLFALKKLHSKKPRVFDAEFNALKKVPAHGHIVPVLAAFNHNKSYYFLFPWAKGGNLKKLWETNPEPIIPRPILWVAKQCYGLTTALHQIHDTSKYIESQATGSDTLAEPDTRPFGRHGDIKPENVLQFEDNDSEMGVLKISDFGLTEFHNENSRSRDQILSAVMALTYNPPETIRNTSISRRYDIWGLGCLYLDFLTWLFSGFEGVDKFGDTRMDEQGHDKRHKYDQFFKVYKRGRDRVPVVKQVVKKHIQNLQARDDCSDFLFDFLEIIKNYMLVADEKKRIECGDLEMKLKEMVERCCDEAYLFNKSPKASSSKAQKGKEVTTHRLPGSDRTYGLRKRPRDREINTANSKVKKLRRTSEGEWSST
ncbi:kinase-like protein [Jackrogersella minutella]|nr:kinase-like protein [Jackrogersella minutella]